MKFKNTQKGFVGFILLILLVVGTGGGVYFYQKNKLTSSVGDEYPSSTTTTSTVHTEVAATTTMKVRGPDETLKIVPDEIKAPTLTVNGNTLSVKNEGKVIQTITLGEYGEDAKSFGNPSSFVTDKDVNFDGHNDIGVLSGSGYMGVNTFYDYYLYNSSTGTYNKSADLVGLSIAGLDPVKKQFNNTFKDGPSYTTITHTWTGTGYTKSERKDELQAEASASTKSTFSINGSVLSVTNRGKIIQTITLPQDSLPGPKAFLIDKDVNFDGHNDVGVATPSGFMGSNIFYDYYLYNSTTGKLDKNASLVQVLIVKVDPAKKELTNSYTSPAGDFKELIKWTGSGYVKTTIN